MPATALPPKPTLSYPRPPLVHDHAALFREPAYDDGQPYGPEDDGEDEGPDL